MGSKKILFLIVLLAATAGLSACYTNQVRHLSSDVALLKVGTSTQEDVLVFLGEPDDQQVVGDGVERWLYAKEDKTLFEKTPIIGKRIGSPEYTRAIVTLTNGVVTECVFSSSDEDDFDWADDFSWQEKKK